MTNEPDVALLRVALKYNTDTKPDALIYKIDKMCKFYYAQKTLAVNRFIEGDAYERFKWAMHSRFFI